MYSYVQIFFHKKVSLEGIFEPSDAQAFPLIFLNPAKMLIMVLYLIYPVLMLRAVNSLAALPIILVPSTPHLQGRITSWLHLPPFCFLPFCRSRWSTLTPLLTLTKIAETMIFRALPFCLALTSKILQDVIKRYQQQLLLQPTQFLLSGKISEKRQLVSKEQAHKNLWQHMCSWQQLSNPVVKNTNKQKTNKPQFFATVDQMQNSTDTWGP